MKNVTRPAIFKWRQTAPELILCAVRWYLRYSLSLRDVEKLLAERGLEVDHTTIWRWVQRYGPELEQRLRRHLKPTNKSWRVDETYIRVQGCVWRIDILAEDVLQRRLANRWEGAKLRRRMGLLFRLIGHLLLTLARLAGPGGVRAVAAESLAVKHQLLIMRRSRRRGPNLTGWDRLILGFGTLCVANC